MLRSGAACPIVRRKIMDVIYTVRQEKYIVYCVLTLPKFITQKSSAHPPKIPYSSHLISSFPHLHFHRIHRLISHHHILPSSDIPMLALSRFPFPFPCPMQTHSFPGTYSPHRHQAYILPQSLNLYRPTCIARLLICPSLELVLPASVGLAAPLPVLV